MKIGITGHQDLGDNEHIGWSRNQILNEISNSNIELGYSCLAVGADQLFALVLTDQNIPLIAIIPCRNYESTISESNKGLFETLLKKATSTIELDYPKPSEMAYYEAGKKVVQMSDLIFAIWDSKPAKGLGGTADIVHYAQQCQKPIIHINPFSKQIKYVNYAK